jgi:hypothetical protein
MNGKAGFLGSRWSLGSSRASAKVVACALVASLFVLVVDSWGESSQLASAAEVHRPPALLRFLDDDMCEGEGYRVTTERKGVFVGTRVTVELCAMRLVQVPGESGVRPVVSGAGHPSSPGVPDVPVVRLFFAAKAGSTVYIDGIEANPHSIEGKVAVAPSLLDFSEHEPPPVPVYDERAYTGEFPSEIVSIGRVIPHRRAMELHVVEIGLATFSGHSGKLTVLPKIQFTIRARGGTATAADWNAAIGGDWRPVYQELVLNPQDLRPMLFTGGTSPARRDVSATRHQVLSQGAIGPPGTRRREPGPAISGGMGSAALGDSGSRHPCPRYLVISADHLSERFKKSTLFTKICDKYERQGLFGDDGVRVLKMSEINVDLIAKQDYDPDWSAKDLRTWIRDCEELPEYLLLVGDTESPSGKPKDRIPVHRALFVMGNPPTDGYLCSDLEREGGLHWPSLPDMFCGRLPVQTEAELDILAGYVEDDGPTTYGKIVPYHKNPSEGACIGKRRACTGFDRADFASVAKRANDVLANHHGMIVQEIQSEIGHRAVDLQECMNEEPQIVSYRGHGTPDALSALRVTSKFVSQSDGWQGYFWDYDDAPPPIFLSVACSTGDFTYTMPVDQGELRSFGEQLLLAPHRGAAHFFGASRPSPHYCNHTLYTSAMQLLGESTSRASGQLVTLGQVLVLARARVIRDYGMAAPGSGQQVLFDCPTSQLLAGYNLLGEPASPIPRKNCDLAGFWRFDPTPGSWPDLSGHGRPAVGSNAVPISNHLSGAVGRADPNRTWSVVPYPSEAGVPVEYHFRRGMSVSMWVRLEEQEQGTILVAVVPQGSSRWLDVTYVSGLDGTGTIRVSSTLCDQDLTTPLHLRTAQWHHLAVSLDMSFPDAGLALFVDGEAVASSIGCDWAPQGVLVQYMIFGKDWPGAVDEIRLYDDILTEQDARSIYEFAAPYLGDVGALSIDFNSEFGSEMPRRSVGYYSLLDRGPAQARVLLGPGSAVGFSDGIEGNSVWFDGSSYLVVEESGRRFQELNHDFGVSVWLRPEPPLDMFSTGSLARFPGVFHLYADYSSERLCLDLGHGNPYCLHVENKETIPPTMTFHQWHHYAVSVQGPRGSTPGQIRWWVDGVPVDAQPCVFPVGSATWDDIYVGDGFVGHMDRLRVYFQKMSNADAAQDAFRPPIQASFRFEEEHVVTCGGNEECIVVRDLSGFENRALAENVRICSGSDGQPLECALDGLTPLVGSSALLNQDGRITFDDTLDAATKEFAVSLWFRANREDMMLPEAPAVLWEKEDTAGRTAALQLYLGSDQTGNSGALRVVVGNSSRDILCDECATEWTHVVVSVRRDAGCRADVWVNHEATAGSSWSGTTHSFDCGQLMWRDSPWTIGGGYMGGGFVGMIDEFTLFSVPLNGDYVRDALYRHPAHRSPAAARYALSGSGSRGLVDSTPYQNHGDILDIREYYPRIVNPTELPQDSLCPAGFPCVRFNGEGMVGKAKAGAGSLPLPEGAADAFSNTAGDMGLCFWSLSDPVRVWQTIDTTGFLVAGLHKESDLFHELDAIALIHGASWQNPSSNNSLPGGASIQFGSTRMGRRTMPVPSPSDFTHWHHVCMSASRLESVSRLYIDGVLAKMWSEAPLDDSPLGNTVLVGSSFGYLGSSDSPTWPGRMADLLVQSRTLEPAMQHFDVLQSHLQSRWTMDATLQDSWMSRRTLVTEPAGAGIPYGPGHVGRGVVLDGTSGLKVPLTPGTGPFNAEGLNLVVGVSYRLAEGAGAGPRALLSIGDSLMMWLSGSELHMLIFPGGEWLDPEYAHQVVSISGYDPAAWHSAAIQLHSQPCVDTAGYCGCSIVAFVDGMSYPLTDIPGLGCGPLGGELRYGRFESGSFPLFIGTLDEAFVSTIPLDESIVKYFHHRIIGYWDMEGGRSDELFPMMVAERIPTRGATMYLSGKTGGSEIFGPGAWSACRGQSQCLRVGFDAQRPAPTHFMVSRTGLMDDVRQGMTLAGWFYLLEDASEPDRTHCVWNAGARSFVGGVGEVTANAHHLCFGVANTLFAYNNRWLGDTAVGDHRVSYQAPRGVWVHVAIVLDPWRGEAKLSFLEEESGSTDVFTFAINSAPVAPSEDWGSGASCPSSTFDGFLDDFYLLSRPASDDEIAQMRGGTFGNEWPQGL